MAGGGSGHRVPTQASSCEFRCGDAGAPPQRNEVIAKSKSKSEAKVEEESACGYVVTGPGVYLWEESHGEAVRTAGELAEALTLEQARGLAAKTKARG